MGRAGRPAVLATLPLAAVRSASCSRCTRRTLLADVNILLINHYAGSPRHGMEYRPYYLAREWVKLGHRGADRRRHLLARAQRAARGAPGDETIDGIAYRWLRHAALRRQRRRPRAQHLGLPEAAVARAPATGPSSFQPDVVIASSTYPMDIWVARRIARLRRRAAGARGARPLAGLADRAVGHVAAAPVHPAVPEGRERRLPRRRPRGLDAAQGGRAPGGARAGPAQAAHRAQRHRAGRMARHARRAAGRRDLAAHIAQQQRAGRQVVVYAGSHGEPNALDVLLDAATALRSEPFAFVLVGDGHEKARLARARRRPRASPTCALFDPIPKAQIPALLAAGRHRLHRLEAPAAVPLRHRAEQADGLHDGRRAGAALGRGRQRPGGRGRLRPDRRARVARGGGRRACAGWPRCRPTRGAPWASAAAHFVLAHHSYPVLARRSWRRSHERAMRRRTAAPWPSATRAAQAGDPRYSLLRPDVLADGAGAPARDAARCSRATAWTDLAALRLLEVGCGSGGNLLELLRLGLRPGAPAGRRTAARAPGAGARRAAGLARAARRRRLRARRCRTARRTSCSSPPCSPRCSTTPSSSAWPTRCGAGCARRRACSGTTSPSTTRATATCAACRWRACGSCSRRAASQAQRVTLAPPIARRVVRLHPALYTVFNTVPVLRTHVLAWIAKP